MNERMNEWLNEFVQVSTLNEGIDGDQIKSVNAHNDNFLTKKHQSSATT